MAKIILVFEDVNEEKFNLYSRSISLMDADSPKGMTKAQINMMYLLKQMKAFGVIEKVSTTIPKELIEDFL